MLDSQDEIPIFEAEHSVMGFDHADVGGELAREWKLPPLLEECIAYHHCIAKAQNYPRETALVHIANIIAQMAEIDSLDPADVAPIDPSAWEITGLDEDCVEPTIRAVQAEVVEVEKLFLGNS